MSIVNRINAIAKEQSTSLAGIERSLALGQGTIRKWDKNSPSCDKVSKVANLLDVSLDYIITGKEKKSPSQVNEDDLKLINSYKKLDTYGKNTVNAVISSELERCNSIDSYSSGITHIKVFDCSAAAGYGTPFSDDDSYSFLNFSFNDVPTNAAFGVRINGDSMEPNYPNGSIVWVKRCTELKYGELGIFVLNSCPYFKIYDKSGLKSINPSYQTIKVSSDDTICLIGKVIGYYND